QMKYILLEPESWEDMSYQNRTSHYIYWQYLLYFLAPQDIQETQMPSLHTTLDRILLFQSAFYPHPQVFFPSVCIRVHHGPLHHHALHSVHRSSLQVESPFPCSNE